MMVCFTIFEACTRMCINEGHTTSDEARPFLNCYENRVLNEE